MVEISWLRIKSSSVITSNPGAQHTISKEYSDATDVENLHSAIMNVAQRYELKPKRKF